MNFVCRLTLVCSTAILCFQLGCAGIPAQTGATANSTSQASKQLTLATTELPAGVIDASYSAPLTASGGVPPYRWSVSAGNLPKGLTMDSQSGAISGTPIATEDAAFTAWVTDSTNASAKADLAISIASSGEKSAGSFGFPGSYGSGLGANRLANTPLGGRFSNVVSYRFRAKHSGPLDQALVYLIPDRPGYAAGNGGAISVTLHTDDGTPAHNPSSTVLATHWIVNILSLPSPARYFYSMSFAPTPWLQAGQLYHLVFRNESSSSLWNYLSVDSLYEATSDSQFQPTIPDNDEAVLLSAEGGNWNPRQGFLPIYQLNFPNGVSEGIGYMEAWSESPKPITGADAVRETFTPSGPSRTVSAISVRVARVSGGAPLVVRLERAGGALIEEGRIDASTIPWSSSAAPMYYWTTLHFATPYTLYPGDAYNVELMSSPGTAYEAYPIRKGYEYGFAPTTYYTDGHAEFAQGSSWTGWTQWSSTNRVDGDLQFYFKVVP